MRAFIYADLNNKCVSVLAVRVRGRIEVYGAEFTISNMSAHWLSVSESACMNLGVFYVVIAARLFAFEERVTGTCLAPVTVA